MFRNEKIEIQGHEYNIDPTNGLPTVSVIDGFDDGGDFDWAIPEGYHFFDAVPTTPDPELGLKYYESTWTVWFGTLEQIAAQVPNCRFIPAEDAA